MSQWDPNDPNNPYNQQQQWGQQPAQQPGHGQQGQGQDHQGQGQQPWDPNQQQQQWDPNQQQQQWDPNQQQQQQWDPNQQQQQWGAQAPAMQTPGYGAAGYQDAYNETFGDADGNVGAVASLGVNERVSFLRKTYAHLFGAVLVFAALEFMFLWQSSPLYEAFTIPLAKFLLSSGMVWLAFLAGFMAVGWVAEKWAQSDASLGKQYLGLGLYVVAESIMFLPLLFMVNYYQSTFNPGFSILGVSAIATIAIFSGLTLTVFITKKDFSFMRGILVVGGMAALGLIAASLLIGFNLGIVFSCAMLFLAGGYILYYTSKVMLYYRPGQHVAASLALFAALALLFWYVIRIVMYIASSGD